ncbi:MAG: toprim domain-containing protein [Alphaproteobacteria bacterium]|nr:toprim domain-containing protein [Alphaproteobacteria bacterium]
MLPRAQSSPSGRATWTIAGCSEERTRANRVQRARQLWRESHSVVGTPGERYLRVRRIARDFAACRSLRFHPSMTGIDDRQRRPALVAAIRDSAGVVQGVEVVLLSADGRAKAAVAVPRRIVGRLMGGAVHLHIVAETLLVGEGVTTVLSASEVLGLNARALLSGHNLARFTPPAFVRVLVIAVDRDRAGWRAARSLVDRLKQDISVEIVPPPFGFNDWNDYARAG